MGYIVSLSEGEVRMQILGVAIKVAKRAPMQEVTEVLVTKERGLTGDVRGGGGCGNMRQVTLLCIHQWREACRAINSDLPWLVRRANLLVDCSSFGPDSVGKKISFDGGVVLEVTGETEPCRRMEEGHVGLRQALAPAWRAGVTCRVVQGGMLRPSDSMSFS